MVVYELGVNAVNLGIRCFVRSADWFGTKVALLENIKKAFDAAGIHIPYPQRETHVYLYDESGKRTSAIARVARIVQRRRRDLSLASATGTGWPIVTVPTSGPSNGGSGAARRSSRARRSVRCAPNAW